VSKYVSPGLRAICILLAFPVYPEVLNFRKNGIKQGSTPSGTCLPTRSHPTRNTRSGTFRGLAAGLEIPLLIPCWQPHHEDNPRPKAK